MACLPHPINGVNFQTELNIQFQYVAARGFASALRTTPHTPPTRPLHNLPVKNSTAGVPTLIKGDQAIQHRAAGREESGLRRLAGQQHIIRVINRLGRHGAAIACGPAVELEWPV